MSLAALRQRAGELGVETSYWDVQGQLHDASEATLRAIVEVLEDDAASSASSGAAELPPVILARHGEERPVAGGPWRSVGLVVEGDGEIEMAADAATLALPADLPIGCHRLVVDAGGGREGASTVVVAPATMPRGERFHGRTAGLFVPAYALWERDEPLPSFGHLRTLAGALGDLGLDVLSTLPLYAAFLDEPFDPSPYAPVSRLHWNEVLLDDASLPPGGPVEVGDLVDWRTLGQRRRRQLLAAAGGLDRATTAAVERFAAARSDVADFARFATERGAPSDAGFPAERVRLSYLLAQYLADRQLAGIEAAGGAALALDLPIGSHPDGYESWADPGLFAAGMSVGAPPDEFFSEGQNWGFAPQLPGASQRRGHDLWRRLVGRAGEHASVLRIDHVMGVQRLWWIPADASAADGAYVRYPREELLAVIAAEAHRTATTIVGEDLGTVSDEVREALTRWDVIGMYEELFHLGAEPLPAPPRRSVAGIRTHDMPPFRAELEDKGLDAFEGYRRRLEDQLGHPIVASSDGLLDGALERLARSDADVIVADLDDLTGETAAHNVPGMILETSWRRRLEEPTSDVLARTMVRGRLQLLAARRGRNGDAERADPGETS